MYAIVEIAGQQFKVEKDRKVYVHRLAAEEGCSSRIRKSAFGRQRRRHQNRYPVVEGAKVTAKVLSHLKADKVVIFKKKRRKGYCKKNGHRQCMTQIQIEAINA